MAEDTRTSVPRQITLDWRGGGWVLAASGSVVAMLLAFAFSGTIAGTPRIGDGRDPTTYGFALNLPDRLLPFLAASGNPRDFLVSLDNPASIAGDEVAAWNERHRMRAVVSSDLVVGISIGGEERAWPVPMLNVHELVHDTVAGMAVCVAWSPLTRSVVVFDRRIRDRERTFALSGLLLAGNMLFYDRTESPTASLWSQLEFGAVTGPQAAANDQFTPLPGVALCSWAAWFEAHPRTRVVLAPIDDKQRIKETSYDRWYNIAALPPGAVADATSAYDAKTFAIAFKFPGSSDWTLGLLPTHDHTAGFKRELEGGWTLNGQPIDAAISQTGFLPGSTLEQTAIIPVTLGGWTNLRVGSVHPFVHSN